MKISYKLIQLVVDFYFLSFLFSLHRCRHYFLESWFRYNEQFIGAWGCVYGSISSYDRNEWASIRRRSFWIEKPPSQLTKSISITEQRWKEKEQKQREKNYEFYRQCGYTLYTLNISAGGFVIHFPFCNFICTHCSSCINGSNNIHSMI